MSDPGHTAKARRTCRSPVQSITEKGPGESAAQKACPQKGLRKSPLSQEKGLIPRATNFRKGAAIMNFRNNKLLYILLAIAAFLAGGYVFDLIQKLF